jgi:uncharacterized protein (TIGR02246 family)
MPQQSSLAFARAINASDMEAAALCFARDACLITPDATAIRGREEIRPILDQMVARHSRIEVQASSVLVAGEAALASERWRIRSHGVEDSVFEQSTRPMLVLRHLEGAWKLAIVAPWGWGIS